MNQKAKKAPNLHENHRQRVKSKYKLHGLDIFDEHEVLEMALFYVVPRRDTNELAHRLLNRFGSIHQIMDAPMTALCEVEGIGEETACYIKFLVDLVRIYMADKKSVKNTFRSREELNDRLSLKFIGRSNEIVAIILVDAKKRIIYEGMVNEGSHNNVDIYLRRIIELIVLYNASGIVFAHNHPSGLALPSKDDIMTTKKLKRIFDNMNISFIDHIIVADDDYVSLYDCHLPGLFDEEE